MSARHGAAVTPREDVNNVRTETAATWHTTETQRRKGKKTFQGLIYINVGLDFIALQRGLVS